MRRGLIALAVVVFALALVALAPASLLTARIEARVPDLRFEGVGGTVWNGRARSLRFGAREHGALAWRLHPSALLRGRLDADVSWTGTAVEDGFVPAAEGRVSAAPGGRLAAQAVSARLPPEVLAPAFVNTGLRPHGVVELQLDTLAFEGRTPRAVAGRARWREAVLSGPARAALGELTMDFALVQGRILGDLRDAGGPLAVDGAFELGAAGYRLDARLQARDPAVVPALEYLGQPDGGGGRYLVLAGGWLDGWLEPR